LIASAARKDRLRPVSFANLSSRFLAAASTRTVKVVERMTSNSVLACVQYTKANTRNLDLRLRYFDLARRAISVLPS
jgi:hypothetical protein